MRRPRKAILINTDFQGISTTQAVGTGKPSLCRILSKLPQIQHLMVFQTKAVQCCIEFKLETRIEHSDRIVKYTCVA